jgi:intein-encoded DNA endonuclease-like protein
MNKTFDDKTIKCIIREYQKGNSTPEIGRRYNVTHQTILYHLKKLNIPRREARNRALYDNYKKARCIIEQYERGQTMEEIAQKENTTGHSIDRVLHYNGVIKRPKNLKKISIKMPISPTELAYIAGIFDGEGNLQFRDKHNDGRVSCRISIVNTHRGVIDWLQKRIGGKTRWRTYDRYKRGWKAIGVWSIYRAQDVASFLINTYPYLIIKKYPARKALKLFSTRFRIKFLAPQ